MNEDPQIRAYNALMLQGWEYVGRNESNAGLLLCCKGPDNAWRLKEIFLDGSIGSKVVYSKPFSMRDLQKKTCDKLQKQGWEWEDEDRFFLRRQTCKFDCWELEYCRVSADGSISTKNDACKKPT